MTGLPPGALLPATTRTLSALLPSVTFSGQPVTEADRPLTCDYLG